MNMKKTNYYFKIDSDLGRELYCPFEADDYQRARRNLFFCCFAHAYTNEFRNIKSADDRYAILLENSHRVKDVSEEEFNQFYPLQLDQ